MPTRSDATRETNLGYAKKANEVLGSVFRDLSPEQNYATVSELHDALKANLSRAIQDLEGTAIGDPLAVAEMQMTLGLSLLGLGAADLAIPLFLKARDTRIAKLGPDHPEYPARRSMTSPWRTWTSASSPRRSHCTSASATSRSPSSAPTTPIP